jgi:hypothetical protein
LELQFVVIMSQKNEAGVYSVHRISAFSITNGVRVHAQPGEGLVRTVPLPPRVFVPFCLPVPPGVAVQSAACVDSV